MLVNPSNFYFKIVYQDEDQTEPDAIFSNTGNMTIDEMKKLGRYCYLTSDSIFIETNLSEIPQNITVSMENNNLYDADSYYIIAGVDTTYSAEDVYANQANEYQLLRSHFLEGLTALLIGILGCIVTLYYLILVSGYKTEERLNPYLHGFDMITTESCIAMTALSTMFALFLGEKIIYRLIHLLVIESEWDYAERIVRALIVYGCCMTGAFSLLRRYKSRQLWENSVVHHVTQNIQTYFTNGTFSKRLACLYGGFISVQVVCLGLIGVCLRFWHYPIAKAGADSSDRRADHS